MLLTWTKNNHTFKFGGEWAFESKSENSNNLTQGSFAFTTTRITRRLLPAWL